MSMTHYMELLMQNSPWNLLIFMALPVILAETIAITELVLLFNRKPMPVIEAINRIAGVAAGLVFFAIACYLIPTVVIPLTQNGQWRTWIDVLAVGMYLIGAVPMILIALLQLRFLLPNAATEVRQGFHIACVAVFLVVSHVAMIAGMADPALAGWQENMPHTMSQSMTPESMANMNADETMAGMHSGHNMMH